MISLLKYQDLMSEEDRRPGILTGADEPASQVVDPDERLPRYFSGESA